MKNYSLLIFALASGCVYASTDASIEQEPAFISYSNDAVFCEVPHLDVGETYDCNGTVITGGEKSSELNNKMFVVVEPANEYFPEPYAVTANIAAAPYGRMKAYRWYTLASYHKTEVTNHSNGTEVYTVTAKLKINGKENIATDQFNVTPGSKVTITSQPVVTVFFDRIGSYETLATTLVEGSDFRSAIGRNSITTY